MALILSGDTGVPVTTVTGTLPVANGGSGVTTSTGTGAVVLGTSPSISGAVMTTMASSVLTSATAQASTSGTSIDFTGIPSWVKRITVMFNGVSTSGTSNHLLQIGSGSVQTTGYVSLTTLSLTAAYTGTSTAGMISFSDNAAYAKHGAFVFSSFGSNTWVMTGTVINTTTTALGTYSSGSVALSGTLDRVRITTVNGTDTFDAGSINILYE
jgi:hypothetical protein